MSDINQPLLRGVKQLNMAAFAMAAVALLCAASGLVYGSGKLLYGQGVTPQTSDWFYVFAYFVLVLPYFFEREATVEEPYLSRTHRKVNTVTTIVYCLLAGATVLITVVFTSITRDQATQLVVLLGLATTPFLYLGVRTHRLVAAIGSSDRERLFKNKVLLPAFATCLVSFSLGWSVTHVEWAFYCLLLPIILIVFLKEVSVWTPMLPIRWVVLTLVLTTMVPFFLDRLSVFRVEFGGPILIGLILTLGMGVAEVCKRVSLFPSRGGENAAENEEFYRAGANWASIACPLSLCFLPLLIGDLSVLTVFLFLSIQYYHWHHCVTKNNIHGKLVRRFNIVLGFCLPILLCLQYLFPIPPALFDEHPKGDLIFVTGVIIGGAIALLLFFWKQVRKFINSINKLSTYLIYDNCLFLFLILLALTALLVCLVGLIGGAIEQLVRVKAFEVNVYLLFLMVFVFITFLIKRNLYPEQLWLDDDTGDPQFGRGPVRHAHSVALTAGRLIVLVWNVARFPVGLIASLAVFFMLALHTTMPPWKLVLHMISICCVTMAGFVLNDIFDVTKDRLALRDKPLAIGLVAIADAYVFVIILAALSVGVAAAAPNGESVTVILLTLFGVTTYSWWAQQFPILKGVATALLCCAPFAYGAEVAGLEFPLRFYGFLLGFISGRELLLDVKDFAGDRKAKVKTLVAYLSPNISRVIGWTLMSSSVAAVLLSTHGLGQILFMVTFITLLLSFSICFWDERRGLAWSRITLLSGVIATTYAL